MSRRPVGLMCYICGRQYGSASLQIHLKKCKSQFLAQEAKKPASKRRPLPPDPMGSAGGGGGGGVDAEAQNAAAFESYNTHSLLPCENCGRTFAEKPLAIHKKSCKGGKPVARRLLKGEGNSPVYAGNAFNAKGAGLGAAGGARWGGGGGGAAAAGREETEELRRIYAKYAPEKRREDVDAILSRFQGRESELLVKVREKYGS